MKISAAPIFLLAAFLQLCTSTEDVLAGDADGFHANIRPFLKTYCIRCHGAETQAEQLSFQDLDGAFQDSRLADIWSKISLKLQLHEMPPEGELVPDDRTRSQVIGWIREQLPSGINNPIRQLPRDGNQVRHEQLFHVVPVAHACSPRAIWRIRPQAYQNMMGAVLANRTASVVRPFELSAPGMGFRDYVAAHVIHGPVLHLLLTNATEVATAMTSVELRHGRLVGANYETFAEVAAILDPENKEPTDQQIQTAVTRHFRRILLRDPTEHERDRLVEFTRQGFGRVGRLRAVRNMICAVLLTPEAVHRFEVGHGSPDEHGRVMLSPPELAFAIAYALTDDRPDSPLLEAAESGALSSRDVVHAQVVRILESQDIRKPRILQFFREYFEYGRAIDVFKDEHQFLHHNAAALVNDTDQLILLILRQDQDVLRQVLTTNISYVNTYSSRSGSLQRATGQFVHLAYNLPHEWQWTSQQPIDLPPQQRAGVLTQPSWLVAQSDNFENSPIRRGKWIREKLLGGYVPDLPLTVDARIPDDDTLTLRQRLDFTTKEYCWNCHRKMNLLGLPFEQFDHFGRWREQELKQPVVTHGSVDESGDASLGGPVKTPIELIHRLADSRRVRQVFVRHAFRYWMGRNETPVDAATLQQADRDFVDSGGSMNALITSLLTSDSFLFRKATNYDSASANPESR